ncbi:MAG: hypothetical protein CMH30_00990 [Micavibrio sp.]|nr:hypothetical protein [Micavibrio sp.]
MKRIFLFFLFFSYDVHAQTQPKDYADKAIQICWNISQEKRNSGVTQQMREGNLDTALCMENHLLHLADTILFIKNPKLNTQTKTNLVKMREGIGAYYWDIYNNHDGCENGCGTIMYSLHNNAYAKFLETLINDTYQQIIENPVLRNRLLQE